MYRHDCQNYVLSDLNIHLRDINGLFHASAKILNVAIFSLFHSLYSFEETKYPTPQCLRWQGSYVHLTQAEAPPLAGPCLPCGGRPCPQGPFLWGTGNWKEAYWKTPAVLQGHLPKWPKGTSHQHWHLGGTCMRQMCLETEGAKGSFFVWRHTSAASRGKKKEGPQTV